MTQPPEAGDLRARIADIIAAKMSGPPAYTPATKNAHRQDQLSAADAILAALSPAPSQGDVERVARAILDSTSTQPFTDGMWEIALASHRDLEAEHGENYLRGSSMMTTAFRQARAAIAAMPVSAGEARVDLTAELAALKVENEKLRKAVVGQWFYPADGWDQEACHYSPDEVIDYHDLAPGQHIVEVNVATSLPSIWCAVTVTDDEDADERYTFTEHATKEAARAALSDDDGKEGR